MALRTFRSNPALGGFGSCGGEGTTSRSELTKTASLKSPLVTPNTTTDHSSLGDVFCQTLKELIDNAVDACAVAEAEASEAKENDSDNDSENDKKRPTPKRVRVTLQPSAAPGQQIDDTTTSTDVPSLLKITVIDNGCGMENIQRCVDPFGSTKQQASNDHQNQPQSQPSRSKKTKKKSDKTTATLEDKTTLPATAGRYGMGLTLCMLHAQRLVTKSSASIRSATTSQSSFCHVVCVVDTERDSIQCVRPQYLPKQFAQESGTSIQLLIPAGEAVIRAWPRLAEYVARFKLSLDLPCSIEVLAPTLSKSPLIVSRSVDADFDPKQPPDDVENWENSVLWSPGGTGSQTHHSSRDITSPAMDLCSMGSFRKKTFSVNKEKSAKMIKESNHEEMLRSRLRRAVQCYLDRPVQLQNVASCSVPIRFTNTSKSSSTGPDQSTKTSEQPRLQVSIIVHGPHEEEEWDDETIDSAEDEDTAKLFTTKESTKSAPTKVDEEGGKLLLVRMVNRVPILDSSEAIACGFVQGLLSKRRMWNSFGLEVTSMGNDPADPIKAPTFLVRDSDQVAPFLQKNGQHQLFSPNDDHDSDDGSLGDLDSVSSLHRKRSSKGVVERIFPAKIRLANILVIVQIHAKPSVLPLPTLSKGRLPLDNVPIDSALEVGMTQCLRQLQKTNPSLFVTSKELRVMERNARYIPSLALAMASIVARSNSLQSQHVMDIVSRWGGQVALTTENCDDESSMQEEYLGGLIEKRYHLAIQAEETKKVEKQTQKTKKKKTKRTKTRKQTDYMDRDRRDDMRKEPETFCDLDELFHDVLDEEREDTQQSAASLFRPPSVTPNGAKGGVDFDNWL